MGRPRGNCCGSSCSSCINIENFNNYEYAIFLTLDTPPDSPFPEYVGHGFYDLYINDTFVGNLDEMFISYPGLKGGKFPDMDVCKKAKWLTTNVSIIDSCRAFLFNFEQRLSIKLPGRCVYTDNIDLIDNKNKNKAFFSESFHFLFKEKIASLPDDTENIHIRSVKCSPYWTYVSGSDSFFGRNIPLTSGIIYILRVNKTSGQICLIAYNTYSGWYGDDIDIDSTVFQFVTDKQYLCCRTNCLDNTNFNSLIFEISNFSLYQYTRSLPCIRNSVFLEDFCTEYHKHPFVYNENFTSDCNINPINLNGSYILNKTNNFSVAGLDFCSTSDSIQIPPGAFPNYPASPRGVLIQNDFFGINLCDGFGGFRIRILPGFRESYKKLCALGLDSIILSRPQLYAKGDLDVGKELCGSLPNFSTFVKQLIKLPRLQIKISKD